MNSQNLMAQSPPALDESKEVNIFSWVYFYLE